MALKLGATRRGGLRVTNCNASNQPCMQVPGPGSAASSQKCSAAIPMWHLIEPFFSNGCYFSNFLEDCATVTSVMCSSFLKR
ncbi:MAG: hypothetical protein Q8L01_03960, partial [Candidatus Woesebacteria bacterium]|nr:hypothetical protein [Candidatus Woesebacteria bacterium]